MKSYFLNRFFVFIFLTFIFFSEIGTLNDTDSQSEYFFTKLLTTNLTTDYHGKLCSCDLTFSCDIDCLCDVNCDDDQKKVFRSLDEEHRHDERYCYSRKLIDVYIDNSKHIPTLNGELFCVLIDNVESKSIINEPKIFGKEEKQKFPAEHKYGWKELNWLKESQKEEWKAGNLLYIFNNATKEKGVNEWQIPTSLLLSKGECSGSIFVKFLRETKVECVRILKNFEQDCQNAQYLHDEVYFKGRMVTVKKERNCTHNECANITFNNSTRQPKIEQNSCVDVVQKIHYIIVHNGTHGIKSISVEFTYTKVSKNLPSFLQEFATTFHWIDKYSKGVFLEKSGSSGYLIGKALLVRLIDENQNGFKSLTKFYEIRKPDKRGLCDIFKEDYETIHFGVNYRSGCTLDPEQLRSITCEELKIQILQLLKEGNFNAVGIFGNYSDKPEDWLILQSYNETLKNSKCNGGDCCRNLISGVNMSIYFALYGIEEIKQAKILYAERTYNTISELPVNCSSIACLKRFEITVSVSFYDVTKPARPSYAEPPLSKFDLPYDLFYPFTRISNGKPQKYKNTNSLLILLILLFSIHNYVNM